MKWITALGLEQWADTAPASDEFPGLVGDLVRASASSISAYRFPTGDKGQVRGIDGHLRSAGAPPFVPDGESIWEVGVNKEYESKADGEFEKRVRTVDAETRANATFVFVTPRTWNKRDRAIADWLREKRNLKLWKAVEFIDGSMLESWLDKHPAVAARYARHVMKTVPPAGAMSTDEFWDDFSNRFSRPLVEEVLLCGREQQAEQLLRRLAEPTGKASFAADSPDEVIAFAVAAIRKAEPQQRYFLESRAIVVESMDAVRHLVTLDGLIFLPRGQARTAAGRLSAKGTTVVAAGAGDLQGGHVLLPRPSMSVLGKAFCGMGYSETEGYDLARKCGRSLAVLARLKPSGTAVRPEWLNRGADLLPALLAGAWLSSAPADRTIVTAMGGVAGYDAFEAPLRELKILDDPPLDMVDDVWKLRASIDAFLNLGHLIGQVHLDRLKAAAIEVFGKVIPPPKPDEIFRPSGSQDEHHSSWLREGLMTTLLHIAALHGPARLNIAGMTAQQYVDGIVRTLPGLSTDYRLLASLQDNLPLLAEAAEGPFLEALERLLEGDANALRPIFSQDTSMFAPRSPHVALLWALEVLAWDPASLVRVSVVLARLAEIDPGGQTSNRPINTLRSIYLSWCPNTRANSKQRIAALRSVVKQVPSMAWPLLVKLLPRAHDTGHYTTKPKFREGDDPSLEVLTYAVVWENQNAIVAMAVQAAGRDPDKLVTIISALSQFQLESYELALKAVEQYLEATDEAERQPVWDALRKEAKRHRNFARTDWAIKGAPLASMEAVVERFKPTDPKRLGNWLFDDWTPHVSEAGDIELDMEAIESARAASLQAVHAQDGVPGIMDVFRAAKLPQAVASAIHRLDLPLPDLLALLALAIEASAAAFVAVISFDGLCRFGDAWLDALKDMADAKGLPAETVAGFFISAPESPATWQQVKRFGDQVDEAYWRLKHPMLVQGTTEDLLVAMDRYISVGRPLAALQAAHRQLGDVPSTQLLGLLDAAIHEINATRGDGTMIGYYVELVFTELEKRTDIPEEQVASREFAYLPIFELRKKPLVLHRLMVRSPETYMSAICAVFKPSSGEATPTSDVEKRTATAAYDLLGKLTVLPGQEGDTLAFEPLKEWCVRVRALAVAADRVDITDQYIGHLLAHAPSDPDDGAWPHVAVRQLLEDLQSEHVERGMVIERHNMRGVFTRAMGEGGGQERAFAGQAAAWSDAMPDFPRAAAMLRELAASWNESADRQDLRAEKSALRY